MADETTVNGSQTSSDHPPSSDPEPASHEDRARCIAPGAIHPPEESRHPVSYYFASDTALALEHAKQELRHLAGPGARTRITKSSIVELAVLAVLADLEAKGEGSWIAQQLLARDD